MAKSDKKKIAKRLFASKQKSQADEVKVLRDKIEEVENRLSVIATSLKNLYIDKCSGTIPENIFIGLMSDFSNEQAELQEKLPKLQSELTNINQTNDEINEWIELIENFADLKILTRPVVMEFIEKITVSDRKESDGKIEQNIDVEYRFIGNLLNAKKEDIV